ncbi:hypothetical protein GGQ95_000348 [Anoxybacillus rupiensis]|nr:hypothetical protein [Anoxybacillus rupiensis]
MKQQEFQKNIFHSYENLLYLIHNHFLLFSVKISLDNIFEEDVR